MYHGQRDNNGNLISTHFGICHKRKKKLRLTTLCEYIYYYTSNCTPILLTHGVKEMNHAKW